MSVLLFAVSLFLPVFDLRDQPDGYYIGLPVFMVGWAECPLAWMANPLWLAASVFVLLGRPMVGLAALIVATALAFTSLTYLGTEMPTNASGAVKAEIVAMGSGFWLWVASIVSLGIGSAAQLALTKPKPVDPV
ncbi:MAG: hypothetical protein AAGB29_12855 [Planctomycetota bacterium]